MDCPYWPLHATAGPDVITPECGHIFREGDVDALIERL